MRGLDRHITGDYGEDRWEPECNVTLCGDPHCPVHSDYDSDVRPVESTDDDAARYRSYTYTDGEWEWCRVGDSDIYAATYLHEGRWRDPNDLDN